MTIAARLPIALLPYAGPQYLCNHMNEQRQEARWRCAPPVAGTGEIAAEDQLELVLAVDEVVEKLASFYERLDRLVESEATGRLGSTNALSSRP